MPTRFTASVVGVSARPPWHEQITLDAQAQPAQDRWVDMCIAQAAQGGQKVKAQRQTWAR